MKITDDDIQNLAHLSRLELSASESISMKQDLGKILDFVANIEKLDLKNIKPLISERGTSNWCQFEIDCINHYGLRQQRHTVSSQNCL